MAGIHATHSLMTIPTLLSGFRHIFTTDTVKINREKISIIVSSGGQVFNVSTSKLFAAAIRRNHDGGSISELLEPKNEN